MSPGLWAIVADVPDQGWDQAALDAALSDLDWLGRQAEAHEAVIERVMRSGAAVPLKLLTIYGSEERAREELAGRAELIASIARTVRGQHEWTLRVLLDPAQARDAARRQTASRPPAASGRDFLLGKKRERDAVRDAGQAAREESRALVADLSALATRTSAPSAGQTPPQVVTEVTFLVPDQRTEALLARAEAGCARLIALGCQATLSGPWPAYHTAAALAGAGP